MSLDELRTINYRKATWMTWRLIKALKRAPWTAESIRSTINKLVEDRGYDSRQLHMVARIGITGQPKGPSLYETMQLIGRARCLERLQELNFATDCAAFVENAPAYTETWD